MPEDGRPYTLCVSETDYERADLRLTRQWQKTLEYVSRTKGAEETERLRRSQDSWLRYREERCNAVAESSPVAQSGRNAMSCLAQFTDARTAELASMVR